MVGPLPPLRSISPYVAGLVGALEERDDVAVEVLGFRSLYPRFLYPGGEEADRGGTGGPMPGLGRTTNALTWWNPFGWLRAGLALRGDIVHAQWWSFMLAPQYVTVLAIARLRKKRVVLTVHNVAPHEGGLAKRMLNRSVLPFADEIVVHSERNRADLTRLAPSKPITVIPHGAISMSGIGGGDRTAAREHLGLPLDGEIVLAFGHLRAYKGVRDLIEAFAGLRRQRPAAYLLIAGQPWEPWEPYQRQIEDLGVAGSVAARLGFVPTEDVANLFAAADVAVFPYTHFDGQSGAGTLALSAGLPIVVTDVGGLPDLVDAPEAVVPPGDPTALERALERVLAEPALRERLAADSRRKARELSWDSVAAEVSLLYRRCSESSRPAVGRLR